MMLRTLLKLTSAACVLVVLTHTSAFASEAECSVTLESYGSKKLNVVKAVKSVTGLGLKESKDLVDSAPSEILTGVSEEAAEAAADELEASGGTTTTACVTETTAQTTCAVIFATEANAVRAVLEQYDQTAMMGCSGRTISVVDASACSLTLDSPEMSCTL